MSKHNRPDFKICNDLLARREGFALVLVIVVMLLASFLASELIMLVRTELQVSRNFRNRAAEHFLAEAGINLCLFRLFDVPLEIKEDEDVKLISGKPYEEFLPTGKVRYYIVSEAGKIDLNWNQTELLRLFLQYQELDDEQIEAVIDSLADWRDIDDLYREHGAESETYDELDPPYVAKNGPIEDPAEFFLVNGTKELEGRFAPGEIFTVYNGRGNGRIDFNSLSPAMLDFLTEGDEERITAYQEAREETKGQMQGVARDILGDARFETLSPYLTFGAPQNQYFTIVAESYAGLKPEGEEKDKEIPGDTENLSGSRISVLVKLVAESYTFLSWVEDYV